MRRDRYEKPSKLLAFIRLVVPGPLVTKERSFDSKGAKKRKEGKRHNSGKGKEGGKDREETSSPTVRLILLTHEREEGEYLEQDAIGKDGDLTEEGEGVAFTMRRREKEED